MLVEKIINYLGLDLSHDKRYKMILANKISQYVIKNNLIKEYGLENIEFVFKDEYKRFYNNINHKIISSPFDGIYIILLYKENE
jgi:hypothetical protein